MAMSVEKKATIFASFTAFFLAISKLVVGIFTGSMAALSSAIDSLLDMAMSLFNLYAVKTSEASADAAFNYGRGKIEGIAALIEATLIAVSGGFIIFQSASNLIENKQIVAINYAIAVMIFSAIATFALVLFLAGVVKKTKSLIVRADLLHYKSDLWTNLGIIVSLAAIALTGWHAIDSIVSIAIALFIIFSAFKVGKEGVLMLLDHAIEEPLLSEIVKIIESAPLTHSYHFLRTRRCANAYMVDCHLVFNDSISLRDAHATSDFVEIAIAALDRNAKWFITIHLDPRDDSHDDKLKDIE